MLSSWRTRQALGLTGYFMNQLKCTRIFFDTIIVLNIWLQLTVKRQLSQLFRNLRRRCEELKPVATATNHARPAALCYRKKGFISTRDDEVAFKKNCADLKAEINWQHSRVEQVQLLIMVTHPQRRKRIEQCTKMATSILEENSSLKDKKWGSYKSTCTKYT